MTEAEWTQRLLSLRDAAYADFQSRLIPTIDRDSLIGVRTPELRRMAREMAKSGEGEAFLQALPHRYFEENQLHAFLLCEEKAFEKCAARVDAFLPFVDNWATCDQLSPKAFAKNRAALLPWIERWRESSRPYTVRFALGMLMRHFLEDAFEPRFLSWAVQAQSEEYYVNMMVAWFFATALAKQYDAALPFIRQRALAPWTHRKAVQKALESFRLTPEQKETIKACR